MEQQEWPSINRTITDNATACLFMMDAGGRCTFMNPAAERVTGYPFAEVQGKILHDVIHHTRPDGTPYPLSECPINRALPQNHPMRAHEDVFVRKDGSFFPVLCAASPIIENGVPVGTVIEVRDITEEKQAEEALRAVHQRTTEILESIQDGFYSVDAEWRFTYVNRRAEQMWGINRADLLGQNLWEAFPRSIGNRIHQELRRVAEERDPAAFEMYSPVMECWMEVNIFPSGTGLSVYFHDITRRKQTEEENLRLLTEVREGADRQRAFLRDVLASVTEGRLCLCDRPDDLPPRLPPWGEPIELTAASLRTLRQRALEATLEQGFATERGYDLITAVGEASMNAVRHAGGGIAQVGTSPSGMVQVWIEDRGAGISMESLPQATLERGYSSAGTLGHGFYLILNTISRMYLLTGPGGTTVVLEQERTPENPGWLGKF